MKTRPAQHIPTELTDAELRDFEALLREQRDFRRNQLAELAKDAGKGSDENAGLELVDALENAARQALAEIDLALDRMRRGRYGQCVDCGGPIGRDRLEVLPAAARCMPCQHRIGNGRPPPRPHARQASEVGSAR